MEMLNSAGRAQVLILHNLYCFMELSHSGDVIEALYILCCDILMKKTCQLNGAFVSLVIKLVLHLDYSLLCCEVVSKTVFERFNKFQQLSPLT